MKSPFSMRYFCMMLFSALPLIGQNIEVYPLVKAKTFEIGASETQLGYDPTQIVIKGPTGIGFSGKGELYILDCFNDMLKISDDKRGIYESIKIKDSSWTPITLIAMRDYVFGINRDRASYIGKDGIVRNLIWYKDGAKEIQVSVIPGFCFSMANDGLEVFVLDEREKSGYRSIKQEAINTLLNDPQKCGLMGVDIDGENRLFLNGELVTRDYDVYIRYWMEKNKVISPRDFWQDKRHAYPPTSGTSSGVTYFGKDAKGNQYWSEVSEYVSVFSNQGFVIDYFRYDFSKSKTLPAVHPCGDVYFLDYDKDGVYLYRVENVWDKQGRAFWHTTNATVTAPNVRLRKTPSLTGAEQGFLQTDERVAILETSKELTIVGAMKAPWYKVKTKSGVTAWAFGGFIEKDEE